MLGMASCSGFSYNVHVMMMLDLPTIMAAAKEGVLLYQVQWLSLQGPNCYSMLLEQQQSLNLARKRPYKSEGQHIGKLYSRLSVRITLWDTAFCRYLGYMSFIGELRYNSL